jgi:hypothetical protein
VSRGYEDRQVSHASAGLRLYNYFLSMEHKGSRAGLLDTREEWKPLEEKKREVLRLHQSSYSSEKSGHKECRRRDKLIVLIVMAEWQGNTGRARCSAPYSACINLLQLSFFPSSN